MSASKLNRRLLFKSGLVAATGFSAFPAWALAHTNPVQGLRQQLEPGVDLQSPELLQLEDVVIKARLSANENPYGPSPKAKEALIKALDQSFMYPGKHMRQLIDLIAQKEEVSPDHIMLGAGSTEILLAAFLAYGPKGKFVVADPGYISRVKELDLVKVPLTDSYHHDLEAMALRVDSATSLVYVCNPNNPTGTLLEAGQLQDFCSSISPQVPVMVDEAYIDYNDNASKSSMMELVRKGENIMVVRTFSKLHGFAGLRVGYCVAQPETIKVLKKFHAPNSLSMPSLAGAIASYQDEEFPQLVLSKTQEAKEYLYSLLDEMEYEYIPSSTNFVLFPIRMKGDTFLDEMRKLGVSVRRWEFNRQHWCRVSLGKMEQMKLFKEAFRQVVA